MRHVSGLLPRWLGGELDTAEQAAVETHLAACAGCRGEADALAAVWHDLAQAAPPVGARSVWPAVQARIAGPRPGWFFGSRPVMRAGLAAAAVACGLVAGVLLPPGGTAEAADPTLWVASSRALDTDAAVALDVWLDPGNDDSGNDDPGPTEARR